MLWRWITQGPGIFLARKRDRSRVLLRKKYDSKRERVAGLCMVTCTEGAGELATNLLSHVREVAVTYRVTRDIIEVTYHIPSRPESISACL